jgi:hypothetical protein
MEMLFFCVLFIGGYFLIAFVLPVFILVKLAQWAWHLFQTGEWPWDANKAKVNTLPAGEAPPVSLEAKAIFAAETRTRIEEGALLRKREQLAATMKEQGRLDRLAMAYYVEASLREGCAAGDVASALRAKGWPLEDIAAVFRACGTELTPAGPGPEF